MNDSIFKSMGPENTLNAGPQEIVTDESIGIKGRRSAKSIIIGAIVILVAGAMGFATYKQSLKEKPSLGLESTGAEQQAPSQPISTASTDTTPEVNTASDVVPAIQAPIETQPSTATPSVTPAVAPVEPVPATQTTPKAKEPEVVKPSIEKQLDALLPNEAPAPFVQPEKKKPVAKKQVKQAAPKAKESNPEPVASEELVTSEQILIYSE
ncbi:hypothetical protein [Methylophilus sp. QUAN]|uniref:hypothetical protein n=1 Tax=Methylophilus sp. QUAN TaxID=2781020 RepID=UPI00188E6A96|nr:hypothetical protein [Methylophilus sp. QUAN]MBF4990981.1 hypothetical protein [Methylophilus sp. QUAN]